MPSSMVRRLRSDSFPLGLFRPDLVLGMLVMIDPFRGSALVFDESADLVGGRKKHRGAVALHPRRHDCRFSGEWPRFARIRFEAQVHLPEVGNLTVRGGD